MRASTIKRKPPDEGEPWQISFADMMTLIMCFFVIVAAISTVDAERFAEVSSQLQSQMTRTKPGQKAEPEPAPPADAASYEKAAREEKKPLNVVYEKLAGKLAAESYGVSLERRPNSVAVNMRGSVLFDLGTADLTPKAKSILTEVGEVLWGLPCRYVIEGHSDNIPIHNDRYPSNWELSAARASSVARFLMERGFPTERFTVVGRADTQPMVPNLDPAGQAIPRNQLLNRRVMILVEPEN